jgi:hypothetical protein
MGFTERLPLTTDLQPVDHRPAVSTESGCLAKRCAASDPNLHPGQLDRVAALELQAKGRLTVEVVRRAVAVGRPKATRNHHTLTPEWEPWGSPHAYLAHLLDALAAGQGRRRLVEFLHDLFCTLSRSFYESLAGDSAARGRS